MNHLEQSSYRQTRMKEYVRVPKCINGKELKEKPELSKGQKVRLKTRPKIIRTVLHAEYHYLKKGWSYVIDVSGEHYEGYEPKFLLEELEIINET